MNRLMMLFLILSALTPLVGADPPAKPENVRVDPFHLTGRSISWDGPACTSNDQTLCYKYVWSLRDLGSGEYIYFPPEDYVPNTGKRFSIPRDIGLLEGRIYQFLVYSYTDGGGYSEQATELTFVWNGDAPQPYPSDLSVTPLGTLTSAQPQFIPRPSSTAQNGVYAFGFRDPAGVWLEPDWRERARGNYYTPRTPLKTGVTYEVVLSKTTDYGQLDDFVVGTVVYPGPQAAHASGSDTWMGSSNSNLIAEWTVTTPLNHNPLTMWDLRFGFFDRDGRNFDGYQWNHNKDTADQMFNVILDQGYAPKRFYEYSGNGEHKVRLYQRAPSTAGKDYFNFWEGARDQITAQIRVANTDILHQTVVPLSPKTVVASPSKLDIDGLTRVQFSVDLDHAALNNQDVNWLWRDADSGEYWDGRAWLAADDQPPWQPVRAGGQVKQSYWPRTQLNLDSQNRLAMSYQLDRYAETFFNGHGHRRLQLVFATSIQEEIGGPVSAELTLFNRGQALNGRLVVEAWGVKSLDETFAGIVLTNAQRLPDAGSIHVDQSGLSGVAADMDNRALVFRLYAQTAAGMNAMATSEPLPLQHLIHDGSVAGLQLLQSRVNAALTSLLEADGNAALYQRPFETPYHLVVFLTDQNGGDATRRQRLRPMPIAGPTNFAIYLAGQSLRLLDRESDDAILAQGTPLHMRIMPEQQPIGFSTQQTPQASPKALAFPAAKRWRAAVNSGDVIQARLLNPGVPLFHHHWQLFTREEGNPDSEILLDSVSGSDRFALSGDYLEGVEYRLQLDAVDRFGMPVAFDQVFGSIRDLSNQNLWLRWGSRHSEDDYFSVAAGENKQVSSQYYGSYLQNFRLVTQGVNRDDGQMTSLIPGTRIRFVLTHEMPNGEENSKPVNVGTIIGDPYQTPRCEDPTGNPPNPNAPYPVVLEGFVITDSWTGKTFDYGDTRLQINHAEGGNCEWQEVVYPENGNFTVENLPFTWYYNSAALTDFIFDGLTQFDSEIYRNFNDWTIGFTIVGNDSSDVSISGHRPLADYLNQTGQSLTHGGTLTISARDLHPYASAGGSDDPDAPLTRWRYELMRYGLLDLTMIPGTEQPVRAFINIYRNPPGGGETQWLVRSMNAHAGGISIEFKPGLPPERNGVTSLAYYGHTPNTLQIQPDRPRLVTLRQYLDVNSDLTGARVQWDAFQWRWTSVQGSWNGQDWQGGSTWYPIANGTGPFANARVSYLREQNQIQLEWTVNTEQFSPAFWPQTQTNLPVSWEVAYRPDGQPEVLPSNPEAVATIPFVLDRGSVDGIVSPNQLNSGTDKINPLAPLESGLSDALRDSLQLAFAPEPVNLEAGNPYGGERHWWALAGQTLPDHVFDQNPLDFNQSGLYALLSVPFDQIDDAPAVQAFLVPYPDHHHNQMAWAAETLAVTELDKNQANVWQRRGHVFFRYTQAAASTRKVFQVVVFVKASTIRRSPLATTFPEHFQETSLTALFAGANPVWGDSTTHNRLVNISYPDPANPENRLVSVKFVDLNGRLQETRSMTTLAPVELGNQIAVDHIALYDALGRPQKVGKPFYTEGGALPSAGRAPQALVQVSHPNQSFALGTQFWQNSDHIVGDKNYPYAEFKYGNDDSRSDLAAVIPIGAQARNSADPLRYARTHRFVLSVHPNSGIAGASVNINTPGPMFLDLPDVGEHLLPVLSAATQAPALAPGGGAKMLQQGDLAETYIENGSVNFSQKSEVQAAVTPTFGLQGVVEIDADGYVRVTLTGSNNRLIASINNPAPALLQAWGFAVERDGNPTHFDNNVIHLPSSYWARWTSDATQPAIATEAGDLNQAVYHQYDAIGRATNSWPPNALKLTVSAQGGCSLAPVSPEAINQTKRFVYDAKNRLVQTLHPDKADTVYLRDRHGRIRFETLNGHPYFWEETAYDDHGRSVGRRTVFISVLFKTMRAQGQATIDNLGDALPDRGFLSHFGTYQVIPVDGSRTDYYFDSYESANQQPLLIDVPAREIVSKVAHYLPTLAELEAAYPFEGANFRFGDPSGKLVAVRSIHSLEHLYYDRKGRLVCRVHILRDLLEPQVTWFQYDAADKLVKTYNQTQNIGTAYVYDVFDRIVATWDLNPVSERLLVHVAFRADAAGTPGETTTAVAALGPLVDEQATLTLEGPARNLLRQRFSVTGHVIETTAGDRGTEITTDYSYDLRDWQTAQRTTVNQVPVFDLALDYDGAGGLVTSQSRVPRRYTHLITHRHETYHLTRQGENLQAQTLQHQYAYDGLSQLTSAHSYWNEWLENHYGYDRNGNRIFEERVRQFTAQDQTRYSAFYQHDISEAGNQLQQIRQSGNDPYAQVNLNYNHGGEVLKIERRRVADSETADVTQILVGDLVPGFNLPKTITTTLSDSEAAHHDGRFPAVEAHFRYDQGGNRIWRKTIQNGQETVSFFLPNGYENATEFDGWGRAKRGYLFVGSHRLGYKSKHHTGIYIKDQLDTTKLVAALYRVAPDESPSNRAEPSGESGEDEPPASDDEDPDGPLVALSFNSSLQNSGTLTDGSPVGPINYVSRSGDQALWLDSGEIVNIPDHAGAAALADQFTVSAWIYDSDIDDGHEDYGTIVAVGTQRSIRYNPLHFYIDGNKSIVLRLGGGADGWQFFGGFPRLPHATWVHVAATYDGSHVRLYQNGVALGEPQAVTLPALYPAQQIAVGDWVDYNGYRWEGGLDEVRLYSRALTAGDITGLYQASLPDSLDAWAALVPQSRRPVISAAAKEAVAALLVVQHSDSDPYGISLRQEQGLLAAGEIEPHQFTGQEREPELGLTYMNGRWYASEFGRFLQVDPMDQFWNSYSYVGNNPINRNDPSGLYTAQEEAVMLATQAFREGDEVAGYFWMGVAGFASTTDNVSKVFDHHFISQRDDVDGWTYAGALTEVADVIPVGRIAKGIKSFFGIGKAAKAADAANDLKGSIAKLDDVSSEVKGFVEQAKRSGCFVAGTLVWGENGMVPIEEVRVGDKVWSRSDSTGLLALKTIEQTFIYKGKETYLLHLEGINGPRVVAATGNHPFWSEPGRWTELDQLVVGSRVWTESGWQTVIAIEKQPGSRTVYNFTVADYHSYFVGSDKAWVHNTNCNKIAEESSDAVENAIKRKGKGQPRLPDDAQVVRGGTNLPGQFENGSGVVKTADGRLINVSTQSAPGKSVEELSKKMSHGQVGHTTVGEIRKAGGEVTSTPTRNSPDHADVDGLDAQTLSDLFNPTIRNPNKVKK